MQVQISVCIATSFSLVHSSTGEGKKKNKAKGSFPRKKHETERQTIFKDQFVVAATTCKATASDEHCLQPPGGKPSISNREARVGEHQD